MPEPKLTSGCAVALIVAHLAASIGRQKAHALVTAALAELKLPETGDLDADGADRLLTRLTAEEGLPGLAARLTRHLVKMGVAPATPAF